MTQTAYTRLVLVGLLALGLAPACSAKTQPASQHDASDPMLHAPVDSPAQAGPAGANASVSTTEPQSIMDRCAANLPSQPEGCTCQIGQRVACWTGPSSKRNRSGCHDGTQHCMGTVTAEFGVWGPCTDQETNCSEPDASTPDKTKCSCIPGSVIQCDEDCAVSVFCSLTATKTCLPDGTFGPCRETMDSGTGAIIDAFLGDGGLNGLIRGVGALVGDAGTPPSVVIPSDFTGPCRSYYHGCDGNLFREQYTGNCAAQFSCGHAPP